jgi:Flp pilus assembly pilin Flp
MMILRAFCRFLKARDGATAVEMAMIAPILIVLTVGVFEIGGIMFVYHRANEAMTETARAALIRPPVVDMDLLPMTCPGGGNCDSQRIDELVAIGQRYLGTEKLTASNLTVVIESSNITPSGDPAIVTPIITVHLNGLQYRLVVAQLVGYGATFTLPTVSASQFGSTEAVSP